MSETKAAIRVMRFPSYDDISSPDQDLLDGLLRESITWYAGTRLGPVGPDLPFCRLKGPGTVNRIPPTVGGDLIDHLPPNCPVRLEAGDCGPAVELQPEHVAHRDLIFQDCVAAAAANARGVITREYGSRMFIARSLAEAARPAAGVVVVKDIRSAREAIEMFDMWKLPARLAPPPVPRRSVLRPVSPHDACRHDPTAWMIVPASHREWAAGYLPTTGMVICVDPAEACATNILHRLYCDPRQRVYGLLAVDQYYSRVDVHRMYGAFGTEIHRCIPESSRDRY